MIVGAGPKPMQPTQLHCQMPLALESSAETT